MTTFLLKVKQYNLTIFLFFIYQYNIFIQFYATESELTELFLFNYSNNV